MGFLVIPPSTAPPYRRRRKGTGRLLFSGDFSQHVTTRLVAGGYRVIIAVGVFAVLVGLWFGYGLQQVEWVGSVLPILIYFGAPLLGLLGLATVRMSFEYLTVIFRMSGKVHDLDAQVGYLARRAYASEQAATAPERPDSSP